MFKQVSQYRYFNYTNTFLWNKFLFPIEKRNSYSSTVTFSRLYIGNKIFYRGELQNIAFNRSYLQKRSTYIYIM